MGSSINANDPTDPPAAVWVRTVDDDPAPTGKWSLTVAGGADPTSWESGGTASRLLPEVVRDAFLVVYYRVT